MLITPSTSPAHTRTQQCRTFAILSMITIFVTLAIIPQVTRWRASQEEALHGAATRRLVQRRTVETLPVVTQDDIETRHQLIAHRTLMSLPPQCRTHLKNFYVRYDPKNTSRGLGGAETIIVTGNVPDAEFSALIVHECGHVTDLGGLAGSAEAGVSAFVDGSTPIYSNDPSRRFYEISWEHSSKRKTGSKDTDFVSGYAAADPFEDFAETFAFYALHQQEFKRLAATNAVLLQKYLFMHNDVFSGTEILAKSSYVRRNAVPWDVTKLPYAWHAKR